MYKIKVLRDTRKVSRQFYGCSTYTTLDFMRKYIRSRRRRSVERLLKEFLQESTVALNRFSFEGYWWKFMCMGLVNFMFRAMQWTFRFLRLKGLSGNYYDQACRLLIGARFASPVTWYRYIIRFSSKERVWNCRGVFFIIRYFYTLRRVGTVE